MTKRLEKIYSVLLPCKILADVGCDHGYMALSALERNLCEKVYISDISEPSLNKAVKLLGENYPERFSAFVSDGLEKVPVADEVLIAGMGGEEIIKILQKSPYKPVIAVLQPMKNADKLRKYVLDAGYGITRDFLFYADEKYYEIMRIELGVGCEYSEKELLFGRENLKGGSSDFAKYIDYKILKIEHILDKENPSEESKEKLLIELRLLNEVKQ